MYTKEQAIADFRRLWRWLAEDSNRRKESWPEWENNGGTVRQCGNNCPLCEYTLGLTDDNFHCKECPIEWPKTDCVLQGLICVPCELSFFGLWMETDGKDRQDLAKKISELPEKG